MDQVEAQIIEDRFKQYLSFKKISIKYNVDVANVIKICRHYDIKHKREQFLKANRKFRNEQKEQAKLLEFLENDTRIYNLISKGIINILLIKRNLLDDFKYKISVDALLYLYDNHYSIISRFKGFGATASNHLDTCVKKYRRA